MFCLKIDGNLGAWLSLRFLWYCLDEVYENSFRSSARVAPWRQNRNLLSTTTRYLAIILNCSRSRSQQIPYTTPMFFSSGILKQPKGTDCKKWQKVYFLPTVTSAWSARAFSTGRDLLGITRYRLRPESMVASLCLHLWDRAEIFATLTSLGYLSIFNTIANKALAFQSQIGRRKQRLDFSMSHLSQLCLGVSISVYNPRVTGG